MRLSDGQLEYQQQEESIVIEGISPVDEVESLWTRLEDYIQRERHKQEFDRMAGSGVRADKFHSEGELVRKFQGVGLVHEDDVFRDLAFYNRIADVESQFQCYTASNESDRWHRAMAVAYICDRSRFTTGDPPECGDSLHVTGDRFSGCV